MTCSNLVAVRRQSRSLNAHPALGPTKPSSPHSQVSILPERPPNPDRPNAPLPPKKLLRDLWKHVESLDKWPAVDRSGAAIIDPLTGQQVFLKPVYDGRFICYSKEKLPEGPDSLNVSSLRGQIAWDDPRLRRSELIPCHSS